MSEAERLYTAEEYLAFEEAVPERHEFVRGRIYAMSGGADVHEAIKINVTTALRTAIRGRGCSVRGSDLRVWIPAADAFKYPDASALCGRPEFREPARNVSLLNPSLLVEVLSPSTETYDRTEKFALYQRLDSLREYVLVAQDRFQVERFTRDAGWQPTVYTELSDVVALPSLGVEFALRDVYDEVRLSPPRSRPRLVREPIVDIHAYAARRFRDGSVVIER
ncbi:MAG TPA: Uma2 family endonuclease [Gemmatirosa sp.]